MSSLRKLKFAWRKKLLLRDFYLSATYSLGRLGFLSSFFASLIFLGLQWAFGCWLGGHDLPTLLTVVCAFYGWQYPIPVGNKDTSEEYFSLFVARLAATGLLPFRVSSHESSTAKKACVVTYLVLFAFLLYSEASFRYSWCLRSSKIKGKDRGALLARIFMTLLWAFCEQKRWIFYTEDDTPFLAPTRQKVYWKGFKD